MTTAKSKGFTLIEIMLALLIFTIIALIVTIGLSDIIKAHNRDAADAKRLEQLQIAMAIMQLDFQQIISREIVDGRGDRLAALISQDNYIEFTRTGFSNPLSTLPYSNLERVGYSAYTKSFVNSG
jgi:general secretion pathway protein J